MNNQNLLSIGGNKAQNKKGLVLLSSRELDKMRVVGKLAANLLNHLEPMVQPGVTTKELDDEAARFMKANGSISATIGYAPPNHPPYPGHVCTSVNEVVCHGIPNSKQVLKEGDIINIDVTPILDGYHGDTSRTFLVGDVSDKARKLVEVTRESMMRGIAQVKPDGRIGDIGAAIQEYAEANGYSVVRDMVGHGVGRVFHTEPQVPHYGKRNTGMKLRKGMVFTIEPMLNEGTYKLKFLKDGWTVITQDRKLSAQFEHTVAVTDDGVEILTLAD
ncbi:methionine aminopeptidase, type I [Rivularia sp. PCC 7116]|uniref:type I methionyl aminopeptidase n=1 Tax=Rivularia sp. PCC 7116 TaxID=373994 RepID=UPI00029EFB3A|nr:type I methionyl aminopeptidase [Rivularia sp. PCC 7116]AFY57477.1 methionine aminopeptidase, type I [Rivularia sp. PCC 7116]